MAAPSEPIRVYNRRTGQLETEQVYGERWLRWTYGHPLGRLALHGLVRRAAFSRWYGRRMDRPASRRKIRPFIEAFGIDEGEMLEPVERLPSFNAFFTRHLKPEARPQDPDPARAVFPADGRHLILADVTAATAVYAKNQRFDLAAFLGDAGLARTYAGGCLVISRLCPVDYHRFHFPCAGIPAEPVLINGPLYSVSPIALRRTLGYLWQNKRSRVALTLPGPSSPPVQIIAIGATNVGSIQWTYTPGVPQDRGAEAGCFAFGGSCIATLFPPGRLRPDADLLEQSGRQVETYARVGEGLGRLLPIRH